MKTVFKNKLYKNSSIELRRSDKDGWGVFARRDIKQYSILEESPIIVVQSEKISEISECFKYCYGFDHENVMIGLGFAGLYNHSSNPNAEWRDDRINMIMEHYALRDISAGEEIFINYGEDNIDFDVK